jgi:hypothetical protein
VLWDDWCPILPYAETSELSAQEIQEDVFYFMTSGIHSQQAWRECAQKTLTQS